MMQLLKNVWLTQSVVRQHLTDDPVILFLQLSRRLPSAVLPLAERLCRRAPKNSISSAVLFVALAAGDDADVERRLLIAAADGSVGGERARRLADLALAANLPALADSFLAKAGASRHLQQARARRLWYDGAISEAVEALKGAGAAGMRQQARLAAEAAILADAVPSLERRAYVPVPGRILHLLTNSLPHTASGYAQRSHSTLLAQREAGWDVLAVTRLGYPVQVGKVFAKSTDTVDGVRYQRLLPSTMARTIDARLQQQAEQLLAVALEFKPSVLHTTTHYVNGLVVRAVAQALGIPWVYEVRGQLADTWASTRGPEARNSEKYRAFQRREAEVMKGADLVLTLGTAMKANIVAAGIPDKKVIIAPNAVGGDFLSEPLDKASARRELGLAEDGQFIGTVSSLVNYEGIEDLLAAFILLAPDLPELRLLIVGDGAAMPSLQMQAQRSGYAGRIIFTGRVPRGRAALYHQALDVFVVPRKDLEVTRSVTPLKPVEAMACARPVVASALPALAEIVEDGVTGLLAAPEEPAAFAAAIRGLLSDVRLAAEFGAAGRERVLSERTWAANAVALARELEMLGVTI
ncbi:glycosyltransferase involved in cell wall biosynthesis [Arthrobacter sp. V4I6]|uniref:glycosyltransferase family 4 protein n=1 Tax=unclassified Arthrobacter TaxID=235627 RepID=UPI002786D0FB|nr:MULTISPECIES: glycosyltransferase family 4 protein [unclassified Arthrobacter]MDQ0820474.1 glycosyltransferase involved in cell wall biosynthesis [Arthrobacter sp. V1I7]MDQ0854655.1 glycosyltransferase involved in cell wall biosynthesis [Arthrobacter sp. V4I6]